MAETASGDNDDANTLRILIATDIHLGYAERDPVRGNDSLVTFEEILENAQKLNVDFVLLGGDLFHENKPSRHMMHGCMSLLRKYCMGDKPVEFEFLSDESVNFGHCQFPTLNYEDPNFNISIPVFSIHGNHDDPTGAGNLCSLDLLHSAGLINYFGKTTSLEKIQLSPLLLKKGTTKLAMYGLGSVRDERLHRMFVKKDVTMLRPKENKEDWFNLLLLHQNRSQHSVTNHICEQFLDDFLDLVFWGHEHECRIKPEWNGMQNLYITQPGSSIATSLSEGETKQKHIGLLMVRGRDFRIKPIALKTVRQFYMEDIVLADTSISPDDLHAQRKVEAYCQQKVEEMLELAAKEHTGNRKQPKEPLIRLRIDYTGFEAFSVYRFGRQFMKRVANPDQMLHFHQKRKLGGTKAGSAGIDDDELLTMRPQALDTARVEDMVRDYFSKVEAENQLQILTEKGMSEAVKEFVLKEEREAISELVKYQLQKTQQYLKNRNTAEDAIDAEVFRYKDERKKKKEEDEEVQEAMKRAQSIRNESQNDGNDDDVDMDMDEPAPSTRGRGRGRGQSEGRGRGQARGRGRGRGSKGATESDDEPARGRGRGSRGARGGKGKAPVVAETSTRSVRDMWSTSSQSNSSRSRNTSKASYRFDDSDDEAVTISDDDDEPFNIPSARQKNSSMSSSRIGKRGRGIVFDDDSDDEHLPSVKRKR